MMTDVFQSCKPVAMAAYDYFEDLTINFTNYVMLSYESVRDHFISNDADNLPYQTKLDISDNRENGKQQYIRETVQVHGIKAAGHQVSKVGPYFQPQKNFTDV